ncbi:MAG: hypothetical protein M3Q07_09010 [Pseudobdellovibrionaceae bacterium]|nr:hypothetical protein [Pseudobdellovibrionaceae bacterium]
MMKKNLIFTFGLMAMLGCADDSREASVTTNEALRSDKSAETELSKSYLTTWSNVSVSADRELKYSERISFKVFVDLAEGTSNGDCEYDRSKNITYLEAFLGVKDKVSEYPEDFSILTGRRLNDHPRFFAPGNLCDIKYPYDYRSAPIFMSYAGQTEQIGKFVEFDKKRPQSTRPIFCEGEFSKICTVSVVAGASNPELENSNNDKRLVEFEGHIAINVGGLGNFIIYKQ